MDEKLHLIGKFGNDIIHPSLYFLKETFIRKLPRIKISEEGISTHKIVDSFENNYVISLKSGC